MKKFLRNWIPILQLAAIVMLLLISKKSISQTNFTNWVRIIPVIGVPVGNPNSPTPPQKYAAIDFISGEWYDYASGTWVKNANFKIAFKGDKGDTGPQGVQGIQGERGADGTSGTGSVPFLTPEQFGAKGSSAKITSADLSKYSNVGANTNDTYDWAAWQQLCDATKATGSAGVYAQSARRYTLSRQITLSNIVGQTDKALYMFYGNGCYMIAQHTDFIFSTPTANPNLSVGYKIEGFNLVMNSGASGINLQGTYGSLVTNNTFEGGKIGLIYKWTMGSAITYNRFSKQDSISIDVENWNELCGCYGAYGSNVVTIEQNRVYGKLNAYAGYYIEASGNVVMRNNVSEGSPCKHDVLYSSFSTPQYMTFDIHGHWFEHPTNEVCQVANLWIRPYSGYVNIDGVMITGGLTGGAAFNWLEVNGATAPTKIMIQNVGWIAQGAKIKNTSNNSTFTFMNVSNNYDFNNSQYWSQNKPSGTALKIY